MPKPLRFTLHLNTGSSIPVIVQPDEDDEKDSENLAEFLMDKFNAARPAWYRLGHVTFFSGAVSAIEVETF